MYLYYYFEKGRGMLPEGFLIRLALFIFAIILGVQQIRRPHLFIRAYDFMTPDERSWRVVVTKILGVLFIIVATGMMVAYLIDAFCGY
ncbi:MAG: hypothetical protein FWC16_14015 [Defluviitaleaceae bacterium]|nr:hypothetical protein [Defluviitaleaceae bacterium]MCL2276028.1 hypothetical protein [Defluviitaleaceae bacterium]